MECSSKGLRTGRTVWSRLEMMGLPLRVGSYWELLGRLAPNN